MRNRQSFERVARAAGFVARCGAWPPPAGERRPPVGVASIFVNSCDRRRSAPPRPAGFLAFRAEERWSRSPPSAASGLPPRHQSGRITMPARKIDAVADDQSHAPSSAMVGPGESGAHVRFSGANRGLKGGSPRRDPPRQRRLQPVEGRRISGDTCQKGIGAVDRNRRSRARRRRRHPPAARAFRSADAMPEFSAARPLKWRCRSMAGKVTPMPIEMTSCGRRIRPQ